MSTTNSNLYWAILFVISICSVIFIVFICIFCLKEKNRRKQLYIMNSEHISSSVPTNMSPGVNPDKQKYFSHDVRYLSISSGNLESPVCKIKTTNHFSYNIFNLFKSKKTLLNNKSEDMNRILSDLEDSPHMDVLHKNFDKSVLSLQWNETSESIRDETYSCISSDSRGTFVSVVPFHNRSYSVAETFKSTNSEN